MFPVSVADPRGVTHADPLQPADYRRLFAVLDDVVAADGVTAFRRTLLASLARHFSWTNATILQAPAEEVPPGRTAYDDDPLSLACVRSRLRSHGAVAISELRGPSEPERLVIERFRRGHGIVDAIIVLIGAEAVGADHLVVAFAERASGRWDRAVLAKLGRHLAPLFQRHLAEHRLATGASLTKRELQITDLVAEGLSNREIARKLHVTVDTVKKHLSHIFVKTGCSSRTQLAVHRSNGVRIG